MAEYYAVLKKAIGKLDPHKAEARRTVYQAMRKALIDELNAATPPLSTAEKAGQRLEFEEAIRKVEREAVVNFQPPPPPSRVRAVPLPMPASAPAEEDSRSPQDMFRGPVPQAESRGSEADLTGAIERAAVSTRTEHDQNSRAPSEPVIERAPRVPARREREQLPQSESADGPPVDSSETADPALAADGQPSRRGSIQPRNSSANARPWRRPSFLLIVLITAVVLGVGVLAWSRQIGQIISGLENGRAAGPTLVSSAVPNSGAPSADAESAKAVQTVNPPVDNAASPAAPIAPEVGATPAPLADAGAKPTATEGAADEASPAGAATPPVTPADENPDVGAVPAAQKGVLHEESVNSKGVATIDAAVTWRYVDDGADGPAIEADLQVPQRGMKIKITIHKNTDSSLAASHLIEIKIDVPADLPGKSIQKLTRIFMKPTEEARGAPLLGAAAKITDGFFWIALSGADADLARNLALLRDGEWIDLPFAYETGQRGILTFEKGSQGDQVFQKAMAAWTTG
jgi:hypothetical protein